MQHPFMTLNLNNVPLFPYSIVNYFGIYIDEQLNFKSHFEYIEHKISHAVGNLTKLKSFLSKPGLVKLYYAMMHTHLLCGLAI